MNATQMCCFVKWTPKINFGGRRYSRFSLWIFQYVFMMKNVEFGQNCDPEREGTSGGAGSPGSVYPGPVIKKRSGEVNY